MQSELNIGELARSDRILVDPACPKDRWVLLDGASRERIIRGRIAQGCDLRIDDRTIHVVLPEEGKRC